MRGRGSLVLRNSLFCCLEVCLLCWVGSERDSQVTPWTCTDESQVFSVFIVATKIIISAVIAPCHSCSQAICRRPPSRSYLPFIFVTR